MQMARALLTNELAHHITIKNHAKETSQKSGQESRHQKNCQEDGQKNRQEGSEKNHEEDG